MKSVSAVIWPGPLMWSLPRERAKSNAPVSVNEIDIPRARMVVVSASRAVELAVLAAAAATPAACALVVPQPAARPPQAASTAVPSRIRREPPPRICCRLPCSAEMILRLIHHLGISVTISSGHGPLESYCGIWMSSVSMRTRPLAPRSETGWLTHGEPAGSRHDGDGAVRGDCALGVFVAWAPSDAEDNRRTRTRASPMRSGHAQ